MQTKRVLKTIFLLVIFSLTLLFIYMSIKKREALIIQNKSLLFDNSQIDNNFHIIDAKYKSINDLALENLFKSVDYSEIESELANQVCYFFTEKSCTSCVLEDLDNIELVNRMNLKKVVKVYISDKANPVYQYDLMIAPNKIGSRIVDINFAFICFITKTGTILNPFIPYDIPPDYVNEKIISLQRATSGNLPDFCN